MKRLWRRLTAGRQTRSLGDRGERHAARWLRRHGYRILKRKLVIGRDEADLIAVAPDGETLVIVEVKTRRGEVPFPEMAVNHLKQYRLARLASRLERMPEYRDHPIRFDTIAIVWPTDGKPDLKHYEDAFGSPF